MYAKTLAIASLFVFVTVGFVPGANAAATSVARYPVGLFNSSVPGCIHVNQVPPTVNCGSVSLKAGYAFEVRSTGGVTVNVQEDSGLVAFYKVVKTTTSGNVPQTCLSEQGCWAASNLVFVCLSWAFLNANQVAYAASHAYVSPASGEMFLTSYQGAAPTVSIHTGTACSI